MIKKLLIANRGEIVLRIIRTAREMGIRTVAVYSEADRQAPHVFAADEAYFIGPAPSSQSYLNIDRIIGTAKAAGADAIHPGYGFLSERADFAEAVKAADITFVGPTPESIRVMGDKLAAKQLASAHEVPMVPGTEQPIRDPKEAAKIAEDIGYPILIKAAAGGGGKGMRLVKKATDLVASFKMATSEALSSFGDGAVFIEKYIQNPKHIEIQVMADQYGHAIHLFERECSIQRRHQKVVEEAPSPIMNEKLRKKMTDAALNITRACHYVGAGTVEFLVDDDESFYFLEMNTRLQVEHPVTEMITGLDLVRLQIEVANGLPLRMEQEDVSLNGHSIQLRVYAEDTANGFAPASGNLQRYQTPRGANVRVDDGVEEGQEISIYYDPMLAKLIVWGNQREEAIAQMRHALEGYIIHGISTTLPFGYYVMDHQTFQDGSYNTHFVDQYFGPKHYDAYMQTKGLVASAVAGFLQATHQKHNCHLRTSQDWWQRRHRT